MRKILVIPLAEVKSQLEKNTRKDIKVVAPEILSNELFEILRSKGKLLKKELNLDGDTWLHSNSKDPNKLVESKELDIPRGKKSGELAISFSSKEASQDVHYHKEHAKLIFSEHHLEVKYRMLGEIKVKHIDLPEGGLIFIGPKVVHFQIFHGLTLILEYPMSKDDKVIVEL